MRFVATVMAAVGVFATMSAGAAGFDCARASTQTEKTICASAELSNLDSRLAGAYQVAKANSVSIPPVERGQRVWLAQVRDKCGDESCLIKAYEDRIAVLLGSPTREEIEAEDANPPPGSSDQSKGKPLEPVAAPEAMASVALPPAAPQSVAPDQPASAALKEATAASAAPAAPATQPRAAVTKPTEAIGSNDATSMGSWNRPHTTILLVLGLLLGVAVITATLLRKKGQSRVVSWGGGFLAACISLALPSAALNLLGQGGSGTSSGASEGTSAGKTNKARSTPGKAEDAQSDKFAILRPFAGLSLGMTRDKANALFQLGESTRMEGPIARMIGLADQECVRVAGPVSSGEPGLQFSKMSLCFSATGGGLVGVELTVDESSRTEWGSLSDVVLKSLKERFDQRLGVKSTLNESGVSVWTVVDGPEQLRATLAPNGLITVKGARAWAGSVLPPVSEKTRNARSNAEADTATATPREAAQATAHRYTALVTCSSGGTNVTVFGCFEDTELRISRSNRTQAFNRTNLNQAGQFNGVTLTIPLGESFSLRAQNSHVVLALGVQISDETGKVVFEDQRATRGGVIAVKSD